MTHRQVEIETQSPEVPNGGATGSEVNNDSPPNDSPPATSTRKKPRHSTCEITEEVEAPTEGTVQEVEEVEERKVYYFSQYLSLRLWRAVENFEVWDSTLVRAFAKGPRCFADRVNGAARGLRRRLTGSGRTDVRDVDAEVVTQSVLNRLRPRGLYDVCARIFRRKRKANAVQNVRPLKRKKPDSEAEGSSTFDEDSTKFKHRFLMAPPRLIVLSGPDKKELDGDAEVGE